MLQVFHADVAKVDLDVSDVARVSHAYRKRFISILHLLREI